MTSQDFQYLKDTQEKAINVINSCNTIGQFIAAKNYMKLLPKQYDNRFNLSELFEVVPKDYRLCMDVLEEIELKLQVKRRLIKIK